MKKITISMPTTDELEAKGVDPNLCQRDLGQADADHMKLHAPHMAIIKLEEDTELVSLNKQKEKREKNLEIALEVAINHNVELRSAAQEMLDVVCFVDMERKIKGELAAGRAVPVLCEPASRLENLVREPASQNTPTPEEPPTKPNPVADKEIPQAASSDTPASRDQKSTPNLDLDLDLDLDPMTHVLARLDRLEDLCRTRDSEGEF